MIIKFKTERECPGKAEPNVFFRELRHNNSKIFKALLSLCGYPGALGHKTGRDQTARIRMVSSRGQFAELA